MEITLKTEIRKVFDEYWSPYLVDHLWKGDSPPEKMLSMVLNILLLDRLLDGDIVISQQENIYSERHKKYYRPDFIVSIKGVPNKFILECDGYNYHRKTSDEFSKEIRRERELINMGFTVYRFSASELFDNPWECAKEFIQFMDAQSNADIKITDKVEEILGIKDSEIDNEFDSELEIKEVIDVLRELDKIEPITNYTMCRRFLNGSYSSRLSEDVKQSKYFGKYKSHKLDRITCGKAYKLYMESRADNDIRGISTDFNNRKNAITDEIKEKCSKLCNLTMPKDGMSIELRTQFKRAYVSWSEDEVSLLNEMLVIGLNAYQIAGLLMRQKSSIVAKIKKLPNKR